MTLDMDRELKTRQEQDMPQELASELTLMRRLPANFFVGGRSVCKGCSGPKRKKGGSPAIRHHRSGSRCLVPHTRLAALRLGELPANRAADPRRAGRSPAGCIPAGQGCPTKGGAAMKRRRTCRDCGWQENPEIGTLHRLRFREGGRSVSALLCWDCWRKRWNEGKIFSSLTRGGNYA